MLNCFIRPYRNVRELRTTIVCGDLTIFNASTERGTDTWPNIELFGEQTTSKAIGKGRFLTRF